eukprot:TsM_000225100 transcript=TsM_000225100 gene=TsM_000225100
MAHLRSIVEWKGWAGEAVRMLTVVSVVSVVSRVASIVEALKRKRSPGYDGVAKCVGVVFGAAHGADMLEHVKACKMRVVVDVFYKTWMYVPRRTGLIPTCYCEASNQRVGGLTPSRKGGAVVEGGEMDATWVQRVTTVESSVPDVMLEKWDVPKEV